MPLFAPRILQFSDVDFSLVDQSSLRLLRVLRVSRVARIVRILRALPELLILVKAAQKRRIWCESKLKAHYNIS